MNVNLKNVKRKVIFVIVISIFVIYFSLACALSDRRYLYIESAFKTVISKINEFFINNSYSHNNYSSNITNSKVKYLEKENDNLRKIVGLKEKKENYIFSEVTSHVALESARLTINNGYKSGIKNDLPVINEEGLVGFISKTGKYVSEITLITSINKDNMLPVFINSNGNELFGMLSSYDAKKGLFKVTGITNKDSVSNGDTVTLSGYDNNLYKGIYVGRVVKEELSNYGISKTIWVKSGVNFDDILFVGVIRGDLKWWFSW